MQEMDGLSEATGMHHCWEHIGSILGCKEVVVDLVSKFSR